MESIKKSQVSSLFENSCKAYDELYVAYAFFDTMTRAIMRNLPWNALVKEHDILKSFHGTKIRKSLVKSALKYLSGLGVIEYSVKEKIHITMMFETIFYNRHRIPNKYLDSFFNRVSRRSFKDIVFALEMADSHEEHEHILNSLSIKSSPFIAEFDAGSTISKFVLSLGATATQHRYSLIQARPIHTKNHIIHLYFSILSKLTGVKAFKIDKLYEIEYLFSPWSIFGINEQDLLGIIGSVPGIVYESGVVWVVDISFYNVYSIIRQYETAMKGSLTEQQKGECYEN